VLDDLQIDETSGQQRKSQHHHARRKTDAKAETVKLGILRMKRRVPIAQVVISQIGRLASRSIGWYCGSNRTKVSGNHSSVPTKAPRK